jgi:hypothetical protein
LKEEDERRINGKGGSGNRGVVGSSATRIGLGLRGRQDTFTEQQVERATTPYERL